MSAVFNISQITLGLESEVVRDTANAFSSWEDRKISLGIASVSGDGGKPVNFTTLDVVAHEAAHIFLKFLHIHLNYERQPGAIEESFCDIFSIAVRMWAFQNDLYAGEEREWSVGDRIVQDLFTCNTENRSLDKMALRCFKQPGSAYNNHPCFGSDPQRLIYQHVSEDHGGVHLNSAIFNNIFEKLCTECSISPIELIKIWVNALQKMSTPNILQAFIHHGIIRVSDIPPTRLLQALKDQGVIKEGSEPSSNELLQALVDHNIIGINKTLRAPKELLNIFVNEGIIWTTERNPSPPQVLQDLLNQQLIVINTDKPLKELIHINESCNVFAFIEALRERNIINEHNQVAFCDFIKDLATKHNTAEIQPSDLPGILEFLITPLLKKETLEQAFLLLQDLVNCGFITRIKGSESELTFKQFATKIGASPWITTPNTRKKIKEIIEENILIAFSGQTSPKRKSSELPHNVFETLKRTTLAKSFSPPSANSRKNRAPPVSSPGKSPQRKRLRKWFKR